jgi:hypothetical protein
LRYFKICEAGYSVSGFFLPEQRISQSSGFVSFFVIS